MNNDTTAIEDMLKKNGSIINAQNKYGETPLLVALLWRKVERSTIKVILKYNPDVNIAAKDSDTPLSGAISRRDIELVELLLGRGADPNGLSSTHGTVLAQAIFMRNVEITTLLLEKGADINKPNNRGETPILQGLVDKRDTQNMIELLLKYNPDLTIADEDGDTPSSVIKRRHDLPASLKGKILALIEPNLYYYQSDRFISWFTEGVRCPGELYNMIMFPVVTQAVPEISLEQKLKYIDAYKASVHSENMAEQSASMKLRP